MRKVFLLSLLLVVLSLVIPWLVVTLSPAQEPAVQPIPSVTASAAVAPDSETAITALSGGELVETTMADWLPGVVAAEMPASFAPEALRAQAVAARTYILQRMRGGAANHPEAGVCDQYTCCCAHKDDAALREQWGADYARNMARIRQAVTDTDGQYLTYGGQLIRAVFHASSAGATESSAALWSGDAPYLVRRVLTRDGAGRAELRLYGRDRGRRRARGRARQLPGLCARRRSGHMVRHAGAR